MMLVSKEALLGFLNGAVTGVLCGIAMWLLARSQDNPHALMLGLITTLAMIGSCAISGVSGRDRAARAEEARGRSGDRLQHRGDHRDRRGEHGVAARPRGGLHPLGVEFFA
jgi:hypothetical protein